MAYTQRQYNNISADSSGSAAAYSSASYKRKRRRRRSTRGSVLPAVILLVAAAAVAVTAFTLIKKFGGGPEQNSMAVISGQNSSESDEIIVIPAESEATSASESSTAESLEASNILPEVDKTDWRLVLVNPTHKLDGDYAVKLAEVAAGYQLDERIVADTQAMLAAAKAEGYTLQICSAYRSTERSRVLYANQIQKFKNAGYDDEKAAIEAAKWVAPPGTSEHNTGLSADIVTNTYFSQHAELDHVFETYPEFTWLYEHCADYGFVLRFPKDKQEITGITYEPWHYRYVGKENARKIMDARLCLEEYLGEEPKESAAE